VLQSAAKTDSRAGDGTTTSTVLTQALVKEGLRFVSNGHNAVALQRGMLKSSAFIVKKIREMATPVTSYEQYKYIASLSAASEEYGTVIADAITRVGADGAIVVAPAQGLVDELVFTEGTGPGRNQAGPAFGQLALRRPLSAPERERERMPQAAPSLGQPRPISRWGGFDRPHRAYLHTGLAYDTGMGIETGYVSPLFVKEQETSTDAWGRVPPPHPPRPSGSTRTRACACACACTSSCSGHAS
jgi:hypothetical protein